MLATRPNTKMRARLGSCSMSSKECRTARSRPCLRNGASLRRAGEPMQNVSRRIADLSPERRKALESLLEKSSVPKSEVAPDNESLSDGHGSEAITAEDYYAPAP